MRSTVDPVLAAETTLLEQGMPIDEVCELLRADDPTTVRRHLELHRERLVERLGEQRRAVDRVERVLVGGVGRARAG
jgi:DNA-binding transcriptional MerR regulator